LSSGDFTIPPPAGQAKLVVNKNIWRCDHTKLGKRPIYKYSFSNYIFCWERAPVT